MKIHEYQEMMQWLTRPAEPRRSRTPFRGAGLVDHGPRVGKLTTTVPPKRGPNYQGLNVKYKKVKTISEKINGGNRQVLTQRSKNKHKTT